MALNAKVGSFALNTSTGNQSITGVGFQPSIVFFWGNWATGDGTTDGVARLSFGAAVSASERWATSCYSLNSGGFYSSTTGRSETACIIEDLISGPGVADFVSQDSDGFTINIGTTFGFGAEIVNYAALGGSDLTNVKVGSFTTPAATGNQGTTGVGFEPDSLILVSIRSSATASPTSLTDSTLGFGFSDGGGQGVTAFGIDDFVNDAARYQRTSSVIAVISTSIDAFATEASIVSHDADGFTLNFTTTPGAGRILFYVAMKGAQFKVGSETQKTSTGTKATSGVGFTPSTLWLQGAGAVASSTLDDTARFSMGMATSTTARGATWLGADVADSSLMDTNLDRTSILKHMTEGTPTTEADADLSSFDADGFTLDWTTADGTAREFLYFAIGAAGGAAPVVSDIPYTLSHNVRVVRRARVVGF